MTVEGRWWKWGRICGRVSCFYRKNGAEIGEGGMFGWLKTALKCGLKDNEFVRKAFKGF